MSIQEMQRAVYDLWFNHYTKADATTRNELVERFIDEQLDGKSPGDLEHIKLKHPANYLRESEEKVRRYEIGDILADFIIRAEDDESELTTSRQTAVNREHRRNEQEVYIDFSDTYDDEMQADNRATGVISEYDLNESNPEYYPDFTAEGAALTVDEFKGMIANIKANAREYAEIYSEKYSKDFDHTLKQIRKLDTERVAICEECSEVFYKHDMRRKFCDLRPSCEVNAKARRDSKNYYDRRSGKVRDSA